MSLVKVFDPSNFNMPFSKAYHIPPLPNKSIVDLIKSKLGLGLQTWMKSMGRGGIVVVNFFYSFKNKLYDLNMSFWSLLMQNIIGHIHWGFGFTLSICAFPSCFRRHLEKNNDKLNICGHFRFHSTTQRVKPINIFHGTLVHIPFIHDPTTYCKS